MTYPILTGAVLIEANGAALNNAGLSEGARVDNAVVVKQIRIGRLSYPYVSGQAWRRWWREVLYSDFGWNPSPITREKKSAYTAGDPIVYEEDDLFGYMIAKKSSKKDKTEDEKSTGGNKSETQRRISPLKNSLLISVLPNVITNDFGHFSRNFPPGEDIVPFESEHYTTYLQGTFTISLTDVGRFEVGEMRDISKDTVDMYKDKIENKETEGIVYLSKKERIKRVRDAVLALARLRGGAHLARNLSDVSPVVVLVGFLDGGNAPFQKIFQPDENNERVILNLDRLSSIIKTYQDRLLKTKEGKSIFFGYIPTILANERKVIESLENQSPFKEHIEVTGSPKEALERVANMIEYVIQS